MIAALALLAAAMAQPAWAAERAFAAQAQRDGTWTAFRAHAAPDGVMFVPRMVRVQDYLASAKDPPRGFLMWWPARAITACDRTFAFSTGPWARQQDGGRGTFSTIWKRQPGGGWKWLYDSGRDTPGAVIGAERVAQADPICRNLPRAAPALATTGASTLVGVARDARPGLLVQEDNRMPTATARDGVALQVGVELVGGMSDDRSLVWSVADLAGAAEGAHMLRVWAWDGRRYRIAVIDVIGG